MKTLHSLGITGVHDAGQPYEIHDLYKVFFLEAFYVVQTERFIKSCILFYFYLFLLFFYFFPERCGPRPPRPARACDAFMQVVAQKTAIRRALFTRRASLHVCTRAHTR